jgi:outer membrane protein
MFWDRTRKLRALGSLAAVLMTCAAPTGASALDLQQALAKAYEWNPDLNAGRANTRTAAEAVSGARAGMRPHVSGNADYGRNSLGVQVPASPKQQMEMLPSGFGLTVSQNLYDGSRTSNAVLAAQSSVLGAQETLRNLEQNTLLDAVTAYMNVVRDSAILSLKENNQKVLGEQVEISRARFAVSEITQPDVALSEARFAGARSEVAKAKADLRASLARFKQVIGVEAIKLAAVSPVSPNRLPRTRQDALDQAQRNHPAIAASLQGVEAQKLNVKVVEGELLPTVTLSGTIGRRYDTNLPNDIRSSATVMVGVTVPIYDGGSTYSRTRQAKETLAERRDQVDSIRERVIAAVEGSWALLDATSYQIEAAVVQIKAAEIALKGMQDEAKSGQRTVLDVLNAQQELVNARVQQVIAQRDRVVASYALMASVGQLSTSRLGVKVQTYSAEAHATSVDDKWFGTRTTSGQ